MALCLVPRAAAHELGAVRVVAEFRKDGTYEIDCIVDREHLATGFASGARYPPRAGRIAGVPPGDGEEAGRLLAAVADSVHVLFDGREEKPLLTWLRPDPAAAELTLRLSGSVPGGAALFAFTNDAKIGTYLLTVRTEGVEEAKRQWQEAGEEGLAVVLSDGVVPPRRGRAVARYLALGALIACVGLYWTVRRFSRGRR